MTTSSDSAPQIRDDVALLELMLADQQRQKKLYDTTNYYRAYDVTTIPYLREVGLTDFRSKAPNTISSFGAVDSKLAPFEDTTIRRLMYYHAERYGFGSSARPISDVTISRIGTPAEYFEVSGRWYTPRSLMYYMRYGYVGRYLDWSGIKVVAEIGPGAGTQAEIIAQLHPGVAVLLFDIPGPLYVCESYLKAVFGDRVVSYRQNRDLKSGFRPEPGRIYMFGNWQLDVIKGAGLDLFWSAACLSATEPSVAENYLRIVGDSGTANVYLMENFDGLFTASAPGQYGVIEKTTMTNYLKGLADYDIIDKRPHYFEDSSLRDNYEHSFWKRRTLWRRFAGLFSPKTPVA